MKLILFSGDHPRHLFINRELLKHFDETLVIIMQREEVLPVPPNDLSVHDKQLFKIHFKNRKKIEDQTYGDLSAKQVFDKSNTIFVGPENLNSAKIARKVKEFDADFVIWMDTIQKGRYDDTNQMFEAPSHCNYHIAQWFDDTPAQLKPVVQRFQYFLAQENYKKT